VVLFLIILFCQYFEKHYIRFETAQHYKRRSGYTTPDKAGNSSAGSQKGSFGSYLSCQYGTNMKNCV